MSEIFRAYDVRGIYPAELNEEMAGRIAVATARFLNAHSANSGQAKRLVIGSDARTSSPALKESVLKAVADAGCNAIDIGICTTPLFYFSLNRLNADGGIMITASHNPARYNGLKIAGRGAVPIASVSGLFQIRDMVSSASDTVLEKGLIQKNNFLDEYVEFLSKNYKTKNSILKFVVDASNGVVPLVLAPLFKKLGLSPELINFDVDGNFPNHSPDISKKANLEQLKNKILETGADIGFAFDGDADRLSVLDEKGEKLPAEFVAGLLFKAGSGLFRKPKVAYDLRFSRSIKELFGKNGFPSPTGYVFVRAKMREVRADLGGELAGHFDFKEMNYAESAVLAMMKVLNIVSGSKQTVSEMVKPFKKCANSGEINLELGILNNESREEILENLKSKYSDGKQNFLDGLTVEYRDWWFNARFSNTEPLIRIVVEANTEELMQSKKAELITEIKKS